MKFIVALALAATVSAQDKPAGTACTTNASCGGGDDTKMCCGIATGGKVCDGTGDNKCGGTSGAAPNVLVCFPNDANDKDRADVIIIQPTADGKGTTSMMYAKAGITCMPWLQT